MDNCTESDGIVSYPQAGGFRGVVKNNCAQIYEMEINENIRAGYISIGGTEYTQAAITHIICSPDQIDTNTYILPTTIPSAGGKLACDGTGVMKWAPNQRVFYNRVEIPEVHEHILTGTTLTGSCTFLLTNTGKVTGSALFSRIISITPTLTVAPNSTGDTANVYVNSVSSDRKTVKINCMYTNNTLLKPSDRIAVTDGTGLTIRVIGQP